MYEGTSSISECGLGPESREPPPPRCAERSGGGERRGDGLLSEAFQGNMSVHIMYTSEVWLCRGRL